MDYAMLNAPNSSSHDAERVVAICAPVLSYQQAPPQANDRETSRHARVVAEELEVRHRRCLVLGLSLEDNALTLSEHGGHWTSY